MSYTKNPLWKAFPDTSTKITADKLNHIEDGILAASAVPVTIAFNQPNGDGSGNLSIDTWNDYTAHVISDRILLANGAFRSRAGLSFHFENANLAAPMPTGFKTNIFQTEQSLSCGNFIMKKLDNSYARGFIFILSDNRGFSFRLDSGENLGSSAGAMKKLYYDINCALTKI